MMEKIKRLKVQRKLVVGLLSLAGIVLVIVSLLLNDKENKNLLTWIGIGLIVSVILFRMFKPDFGYKPTREELEERIFGEENLDSKK